MELHEFGKITTRNCKELLLRRLNRNHAKALQDFNRNLSAKSNRWFRPHGYDDLVVNKFLARSEAGDDLTLGLFQGSRIVGYFFLWYLRERVPLLGIGLSDEFQGQGLGREMMTLLLKEAEKAGCEAVELTTDMDNERAFALYKKVGFIYYKDVENVQGDGKLVTERAMYYPIKSGAAPMNKPHCPPV